MKAWLTNGRVAWEIPAGRISDFFLRGVYLPEEGWLVKRKLDGEEKFGRRKKRANENEPSRLFS